MFGRAFFSRKARCSTRALDDGGQSLVPVFMVAEVVNQRFLQSIQINVNDCGS